MRSKELGAILAVFSLFLASTQCYNLELDKVVVHSPPFSRNTHFGLTVAGYKVDNDAWILVGAPLTMRERSHGQAAHTRSREGAVYRCKINNPNSCYMLPFDKKGNFRFAII